MTFRVVKSITLEGLAQELNNLEEKYKDVDVKYVKFYEDRSVYLALVKLDNELPPNPTSSVPIYVL